MTERKPTRREFLGAAAGTLMLPCVLPAADNGHGPTYRGASRLADEFDRLYKAEGRGPDPRRFLSQCELRDRAVLERGAAATGSQVAHDIATWADAYNTMTGLPLMTRYMSD